jgi:hypothetical protein
MCMKRGVPARPARGLCNERHNPNSNYVTSGTTMANSTTINLSYTISGTADTTTGGIRWVSPTNRVITLR